MRRLGGPSGHVGKRTAGNGGAGVYVGKVARDKAGFGNWFVGGFVPAGSLRHTKGVELKWTVHKGRHKDGQFRMNRTAMTACIIIRGSCDYEFDDHGKRSAAHLRAGDYLISPPGIAHKLTVSRQVEILVVRWPSVAGDHEELGY